MMSGKKEERMGGYPVVQMVSEASWKPETLEACYAFAALIGCEARAGGVLVPDRRRDDMMTAWWEARGPARDEMMKAQVAKAVAGLSGRARKLWGLLLQGRFYQWDGPHSGPKAMEELRRAGLVGSMGRVCTVKRCWVPVGTRPLVTEEVPKWEP